MEMQPIGTGGYGSVYRIGGHAIKVIACANKEASLTFRKECTIGMELVHPNITR